MREWLKKMAQPKTLWHTDNGNHEITNTNTNSNTNTTVGVPLIRCQQGASKLSMKIIVMIDGHGDGYGGVDDDDKSDDMNKAQPNSDKLWHCSL